MRLEPGTKVRLGLDWCDEAEVVSHDEDDRVVVHMDGLFGRRRTLPRRELMTIGEWLELDDIRRDSEKEQRRSSRQVDALNSIDVLYQQVGNARRAIRMGENDRRRRALEHLCEVAEALLGKVERLEATVEAQKRTIEDCSREVEQTRKYARMNGLRL